MKKLCGFLVLGFLSIAQAGSDHDRVWKLGEKYCAKAVNHLTAPSLSQSSVAKQKKEALVYASLCNESGHFSGKAQIAYPKDIPVNLAAIKDSWGAIVDFLRTGNGAFAAAAVYLDEANAIEKSLKPYLRSYGDEYSVAMKQSGISEEREILKAHSLDLLSGVKLNQSARESSK